MTFSKADYALINLGTCIKGQAERLGIEHEGVPLEGVVVRLAEEALSRRGAAESEDHAATVTGEARVLSVLDEYSVAFHHPKYGIGLFTTCAEEIATALAAPVEVDEAKLAEVLLKHRGAVFEWGEGVGCICGYEPRRRSETVEKHIAHAVTEWLRGEGR